MTSTVLERGPPLVAALAARGIAALRYDRRGVGATSGDCRAPSPSAHPA
ncbi:hypothetical protein [Saccharopolyspora shandongensis]